MFCMRASLTRGRRRSPTGHPPQYINITAQQRWQHTGAREPTSSRPLTTLSAEKITPSKPGSVQRHGGPSPSVLRRLPTWNVLRSLVLGAFMVSPILFKPSFALLHKVAKAPPTSLLNPDRNPLLRSILKPLVYDQFCAGTNEKEIRQCVSGIRAMGFSGVILAYGKEIVIYSRGEDADEAVGALARAAPEAGAVDLEIEQWRKGNLETISMMGGQDILAMKFTGAGINVTNALMSGAPLPKQFVHAMDEIAAKARETNCRIIIDAEQQALQHSIDETTINLMRKYNTDKVLIMNTLQAYLKDSKTKLSHQLALAQQEGWILAIKLVRGAYINNEIRERIHDTKAETDQCYNDIVRSILTNTVQGATCSHGQKKPRLELIIAGHNSESVTRALHLVQDLAARSQLSITPEFGQLQGMADNLSGTILQHNDGVQASGEHGKEQSLAAVKVYKYMIWGTVQECMEYLVRRAVENRGAADRLKEDMRMMAGELKNRVVAGVMGR